MVLPLYPQTRDKTHCQWGEATF